MTLKRRIYLGPRAWGLWLLPRIVMWLRFKRQSIQAEAHICGLDASNTKCRLSALKVNSRVTWVESSIKHLRGDCVPCLLLKSNVLAGIEVQPSRCRWLRLLPDFVLELLGRRAVSFAVQETQAAVARALLSEYVAWRKVTQALEPVA